MAAASQLARRAGPAIYITLAFHRSPLTRHCLGPEAWWPCGSSSHRGTVTACEGWVGQGSPVCPAQGGRQEAVVCSPLHGRKEEANWVASSTALEGTGRGGVPGLHTHRAVQQSQGTASRRASSGGQSGAQHHGQPEPAAPVSHCPVLPGAHSLPLVCNPRVAPPIPSLRAHQSSSPCWGHLCLLGSSGQHGSHSLSPPFPLLLGTKQD